MSLKKVDPHIFVILGAIGNLTRRKLFPALYHLSAKGVLERSVIIGVDRKPDLDDDSFRVQARGMLEAAGLSVDDKAYSGWCEKCLFYQPIGQGEVEDYRGLTARIEALERERDLPGNRVFYMALPPNVFPRTVTALSEVGLNRSAGWTRIVIEKPFGRDLESAKELNSLVHTCFNESQIYRIDHFLGKETVQNLLVFRFANAFFEHLWSREHIDRVEITVAENLGIEGRSDYYEQAGVLRDMVENHLTQLLALITMEPPTSFSAEAIRSEKIKILRQIAPIRPENTVFGQYVHGKIDGQEVKGYKEEPGVSQSSQTETFAALQLEIANWRWKGIPFYLRTGKRMPRRVTEIIVHFHCAPVSIFQPFESSCNIEPNALIITIQPDEGFDLKFQVKSIGQPIKLTTQHLDFRYSEAFGSPPDAYETLLLDVIEGDQTLFVHSDEVEAAWQIYSPLLEIDIPVHSYPAGTWGPTEARALVR